VMDQIGFDPMSWHAKAEAGEFLFLPTGGGGCLESPEIYGWSWIGRPYLERALQHVPFQILAMESVPGLPQEFVLLRSRKSGRTSAARNLVALWRLTFRHWQARRKESAAIDLGGEQ
jgi:hypothetical protein